MQIGRRADSEKRSILFSEAAAAPRMPRFPFSLPLSNSLSLIFMKSICRLAMGQVNSMENTENTNEPSDKSH